MIFFRLKADLGSIFGKPFSLVMLLLCLVILTPTTSEAEMITPYQSVEQALQYSPQLQALTHSHQAAQFDLKQSRGRYLPSVDLLLGYGLEQHSDSATRRDGSDPSDKDWDSRGDATLRLTQKVYDGGETSQQIVIQKALLDSAQFQIQSAAQAVALDAIAAHLDVFRQRELVVLAEKNLAVHQDIHRSLAERAQAGAGDIADVSQAQTRLARAQSTLYLSKADLSKALANYSRVVGFAPEPKNITYAGVPETLPVNLDKALELMVNGNPELRVLAAALTESEARVALARSPYKPKIDVQLSSRYNDQLEGDQSWQNTNDAMLNLRWNLFNGGQDKAAKQAALSRKYQSRSARDDKLSELREATSAAWLTYQSLHKQKAAYQDAVTYGQKTFDAYINQFSVSQRSLLDVLSAENDYFQSASQLITVTINETLAAYQVLALTGNLQVTRCSGVREYPEELEHLSQALILPSTPPGTSVPSVPGNQIVLSQQRNEKKLSDDEQLNSLYSVVVGPCLNQQELKRAHEIFNMLNLEFSQNPGKGKVKIVRLLEGIYSAAEARLKLSKVKKSVDSAYILPEKNQKLGLYLGSFHETNRAANFSKKLEHMGFSTRQIPTEIEMIGEILTSQQTDKKTAQLLLQYIDETGISANSNHVD